MPQKVISSIFISRPKSEVEGEDKEAYSFMCHMTPGGLRRRCILSCVLEVSLERKCVGSVGADPNVGLTSAYIISHYRVSHMRAPGSDIVLVCGPSLQVIEKKIHG